MSNLPLTGRGSSPQGAKACCTGCGAGASLWFNWAYAKERQSTEDVLLISHFGQPRQLRRGTLFRCRMCNEPWHLDSDAKQMTYVSPERLMLIIEWDQAEITLSPDNSMVVNRIGPTPPDLYGNEKERRLTPCKVTTRSGEVFETAMICVQRDAPVQDHMRVRLGSDVAEVSESIFTLPRNVREASSRADEMRMGFSPTLIVMPDGKRFVMNGMTSFMVEQGRNAPDARLTAGDYFTEQPTPSVIERPLDLVYFVFDGDPGW